MSLGRADAPSPPPATARLGFQLRIVGGFLGALTFLTVIPLPARVSRSVPPELAPALPWFPVIGALVGAAAGGIRAAFDPLLGHGPSTVLAMVVLVVVTGALHYDGLADTADGLGVRGDPARRLEVMRDSAIGAFGMLALVAWALLLFTALEPLSSPQTLKTLIAAGAVSRLALLVQGLGARPARADGLGAGFAVNWVVLGVGAVVSAAIALGVAGLGRGALGFGVGVVAAAMVTLFVRHAFGGRTGDTLGAGAAITEVVVCLTLAATWR